MLYINQLNANGGINGKQVKVLEYDDKGDGVEAVNAYNLACDNGITAVFGATLTGPTIALADATYEDNMPQVTASATASGVTMIDPDDPGRCKQRDPHQRVPCLLHRPVSGREDGHLCF